MDENIIFENDILDPEVEAYFANGECGYCGDHLPTWNLLGVEDYDGHLVGICYSCAAREAEDHAETLRMVA